MRSTPKTTLSAFDRDFRPPPSTALPWSRRKKVYEALALFFFEPQRAFLQSRARFPIFMGGVGSGKTLSGARFIAPHLLHSDRRYWLAAPTYKLAQPGFGYVLDYLQQLDVGLTSLSMPTSGGRWTLTTETGTIFETVSFDNPESMHAVPVHGLWVDEAGQLTRVMWDTRLHPRLVRTGGWGIFTGTSEGTEQFLTHIYDMGQTLNPEGWESFSMATWENRVDFPCAACYYRKLAGEELPMCEHDNGDNPILATARRQTDVDTFMERYGAVPKRPARAVYKEFRSKHHVMPLAWVPGFPVELWVDPGVGTYCALFVQIIEDCVYVLDELYEHGMVTEDMIRLAVEHPLWPHVRSGVIDPAAAADQTAWARSSVYEVLSQELGHEVKGILLHRPDRIPINDGISRVKTFLHSQVYDEVRDADSLFEYQGIPGRPRLYFNYSCHNSILEFRDKYRYPKRKDPTQATKPRDEWDHAANAVAYGLVSRFGIVEKAQAPPATWRSAFQPH